MVNMSILFLVWFLYLTLGVLWLNHTVKKGLINEYNVIGALIIVTIWPIHLFYTKIKK